MDHYVARGLFAVVGTDADGRRLFRALPGALEWMEASEEYRAVRDDGVATEAHRRRVQEAWLTVAGRSRTGRRRAEAPGRGRAISMSVSPNRPIITLKGAVKAPPPAGPTSPPEPIGQVAATITAAVAQKSPASIPEASDAAAAWQRRKRARAETLAWLASTFPDAFGTMKPLMIGAGAAIWPLAKSSGITRRSLNDALRLHTESGRIPRRARCSGRRARRSFGRVARVRGRRTPCSRSRDEGGALAGSDRAPGSSPRET